MNPEMDMYPYSEEDDHEDDSEEMDDGPSKMAQNHLDQMKAMILSHQDDDAFLQTMLDGLSKTVTLIEDIMNGS